MRAFMLVLVAALWTGAASGDDLPGFCAERHAPGSEAARTCEIGCKRVVGVTRAVIALCRGGLPAPEDEATVVEATRLLDVAGIRAPAEFEGVAIRFCPFVPAAGMAPAPDLILIHPRFRGLTLPVAALLGHEMVHIDQYRRWGAEGFACRYGAETTLGRGTGRGNAIEDEAYGGDEARTERLRRAHLLPRPRPERPGSEG